MNRKDIREMLDSESYHSVEEVSIESMVTDLIEDSQDMKNIEKMFVAIEAIQDSLDVDREVIESGVASNEYLKLSDNQYTIMCDSMGIDRDSVSLESGDNLEKLVKMSNEKELLIQHIANEGLGDWFKSVGRTIATNFKGFKGNLKDIKKILDKKVSGDSFSVDKKAVENLSKHAYKINPTIDYSKYDLLSLLDYFVEYFTTTLSTERLAVLKNNCRLVMKDSTSDIKFKDSDYDINPLDKYYINEAKKGYGDDLIGIYFTASASVMPPMAFYKTGKEEGKISSAIDFSGLTNEGVEKNTVSAKEIKTSDINVKDFISSIERLIGMEGVMNTRINAMGSFQKEFENYYTKLANLHPNLRFIITLAANNKIKIHNMVYDDYMYAMDDLYGTIKIFLREMKRSIDGI